MKTKRRKLVAKNADRVQFLPPSSQSFFFPLSLHILFVLWKVTFNSIDIKRPKSSKKVLLFNSFVHKKAWESSRHFLANLCSWIVEVSALLFSHEAQSLSDCRVIDPDRNRGNRSLHFLACFFWGGDPLWPPGWFGKILAGQSLLGRFTTVMKFTAYDSHCGRLRAAETASKLLSALIEINPPPTSSEMFFTVM